MNGVAQRGRHKGEAEENKIDKTRQTRPRVSSSVGALQHRHLLMLRRLSSQVVDDMINRRVRVSSKPHNSSVSHEAILDVVPAARQGLTDGRPSHDARREENAIDAQARGVVRLDRGGDLVARVALDARVGPDFVVRSVVRELAPARRARRYRHESACSARCRSLRRATHW